MKKNVFLTLTALIICISLQAQHSIPKSIKEDREGIMSESYWKIWNPQVQSQIDKDIEKYRKKDGEISLTVDN